LRRDKNNNVIFNSIAAYFTDHLTAQFNIANKHVLLLKKKKDTANELSFSDTSLLANTVCPTRYRIRHFFNNFTTNEDIATKCEADYRHIPLHFSHNERTSVQISLQYLHWC